MIKSSSKEKSAMTPEAEWAETDVHRASTYFCGKCGNKFETPHALYAHLDSEHPQKRESRARDR